MFRCPFPIRRLLGLALAFAASTAAAGTVTVITSFPKELTSAYNRLREGESRDQARDTEQEHGRGHRVRP